MVGGGDPFYLKFWVNRSQLEGNRPFWTDNRSYRLSRNTWRKKFNKQLNKSTTRFPMSLRRSLYVARKSPKGGSKTQNGRFPSKIALRLKKVCYKVSLCENCQRQGCRAFIGLTIHAKIIGGGHPLLPVPEVLGKTGRIEAKSPIFDLFSLVAPEKVKLTLIGIRKSTTRFPMSRRWTSYIFLKPPSQRWLINAQCPKFEQ